MVRSGVWTEKGPPQKKNKSKGYFGVPFSTKSPSPRPPFPFKLVRLSSARTLIIYIQTFSYPRAPML